jgi:hypothetical protein
LPFPVPFLSLLMMASDRDDAIAVQRRGRELRRRHGFPAVPAAPAQSGGWSRHGQSSSARVTFPPCGPGGR